jgi:DNA invertase Pin-like site-specific DNA recombinase
VIHDTDYKCPLKLAGHHTLTYATPVTARFWPDGYGSEEPISGADTYLRSQSCRRPDPRAKLSPANGISRGGGNLKQTRVAIYTRVSTDDQSTKTQEHELRQYAKHRRWTVQQIYTDHGFSGALEKRPALDELLYDARKRKFDVVLVWKFDRFARSLRQLVSALELFRKFGIDFVSATEAIDTSLPSGELVFQIFGAIAQFERALIGERVKAGLGQARRSGERIGRPPIRIAPSGRAHALTKGAWRR